MAKIAPFKAVMYNQAKIADLSRVVCPPYDVISPRRQDYFHDLDPYNFIQIILGKDISAEDKYRRAAGLFKGWLKEGVLIQDEALAIYFYGQHYVLKGEKKFRLGFISLLHLDNSQNSTVFAHEHTHLGPKEDRLRLLRQVKANLSPIFAVIPDKKRIIQRIFKDSISAKKPCIDIVDDEKTRHQVWRLDAPAALASITGVMQNENIFIADGHHRYEVALTYRDEMRKKSPNFTGEESFNYIPTYFTGAGSGGLVILPVHRLVKMDAKNNFDNFRIALLEYFEVEEVRDQPRFFFLLEKAGLNEHILGMYKNKRFWLLRLKNVKILDKIITDKPKEYRALDVSILNYIVLNKALGYSSDNQENISYGPSADEFIEQVDSDSSRIAFFLNPVRIQQMMTVALSGERMPPKSTYFYPKVLSGLVINKHEGY